MSLSYFRLMLVFALVLILTLLPVPVGYEIVRPLWVAMFLLYMQFKTPSVWIYFWVVFWGILLDTYTLVPLGEHGIALCLLVGAAGRSARQFRFFAPLQQMLWVFFLILLYQFTLVFLDYLWGHPMMLVRLILPPLISTLVWPVFVTLIETHSCKQKLN